MNRPRPAGTVPHHPNERTSFYGCRTLRFLKGPGLDAASLLNLCDNHRFRSGTGYRFMRVRATALGTFFSAEAIATTQMSLKALAV